MENYVSFNTQKRNRAKNKFGKNFSKLINNGFFVKTLEDIRCRLKIEFVKYCENDKAIKQQSSLTFNVFHKSYTIYSSYTFKQIKVVMDKPIKVGFAIFKLSKLHVYETYNDNIQPFFGRKRF